MIANRQSIYSDPTRVAVVSGIFQVLINEVTTKSIASFCVPFFAFEPNTVRFRTLKR